MGRRSGSLLGNGATAWKDGGKQHVIRRAVGLVLGLTLGSELGVTAH